jgi:predicted nucleic-acid-binding Zn-ribbon protein
LAVRHSRAANSSMIVRIAAYENAIEAHLARMRLEHEGIPAFVIHEHHIWANWLMSNVLLGVKVYVHRNDVSEAREIVRAHDRGEYALPDEAPASCPRCGNVDILRKRMSWKGALLCFGMIGIPLPFRWATLKCQQCKFTWELPDASAVPKHVIALAVLILACGGAAAMTLLSFVKWRWFPLY